MDGNLNSFSNYKSDYFSQGSSIQILIRISYLGYGTPGIHVGKEYVCIDLYILHIHGTSRDHDKSQTTYSHLSTTEQTSSCCFPEELVRDKGRRVHDLSYEGLTHILWVGEPLWLVRVRMIWDDLGPLK